MTESGRKQSEEALHPHPSSTTPVCVPQGTVVPTFPRFFTEEGEEKKATIKKEASPSFPVKSVQRREGEGKEETLTARD